MSARKKNLLLFVLSLALIISALLSATVAQATIYYVSSSDPNRNDGGPGTSSSAPWATLAKVSSVTFAGDDQILFKKGDTWTGEKLRLHNDGWSAWSEHWITVSSYGTGAKPRIINPPVEYDIDIFKHLDTVPEPDEWVADPFYAAILTKNCGGWKIVGLEISNAGNGIIHWHGYGGECNDGFWIEDCDIHDTTGSAIDFLSPAQFTNVTVKNCTIKNAGGLGLNIEAAYGFTFDGLDVFKCQGHGICLAGGANNGTIQNCKVTECNTSGALVILCFSNSINIQDCEFSNIDSVTADGVAVDLEGACDNTTIQRCYFHDMDRSGVMIYNNNGLLLDTNTVIKDNVFVRCGLWPGDRDTNSNAPAFVTNTSGINGPTPLNEISNNVIYKTYAEQKLNWNEDNVIPNSSFENTTVEWELIPSNLATIETAGDAYFNPIRGSKYLKLLPNSSATITVPYTSIVPGCKYTLYSLGYLYTAAGSTGQIRMVIKNDLNVQIGEQSVSLHYASPPPCGYLTANSWGVWTDPIPTDAHHLEITISNTGGSATLYIDVVNIFKDDLSDLNDNWPMGFAINTPNKVYHFPGGDFKAGVDFEDNIAQHPDPSDPVQGHRQWYYKYRNGTSYSDMTWYAENNGFIYGTPPNWQVYVGKDWYLPGVWMHPNTGYDAVSAWKAPYAGTVQVKGTATLMETSGSNGVVASITHGTTTPGTTKWSQTLDNSNPPASTTASHDLPVRVNKDEYVRFEVNNNGDTYYDGTGWDPKVNYTEVSPNESTSSPYHGQQWKFGANVQGWAGYRTTVAWETGGYLKATISNNTNPKYVYSPPLTGDARIDTSIFRYVKIRMKNSTTRTTAKLWWITDQDTGWDTNNKSITFPIKASDTDYREYIVDVGWQRGVAGTAWKDKVTQLRVEVVGATTAAGNNIYRLDYVKALPGNQWGFNTANDFEGWVNLNELDSPSVSGGCLNVPYIVAYDPYMASSMLWFDAKSYKYLKVRMSHTGLGTNPYLHVYWTTQNSPNIDETKTADVDMADTDSGYTTYVVPLHGNSEWKDIITQLRVDIEGASPGGSFSIDSITLTNNLYDDRCFYF